MISPKFALAALTLIACALNATSGVAFTLPGLAQDNQSLINPIAVFPHDNRQELLDSSSPWRAIGLLFLPDGSSCTASLIGPDLVLTNAHCVADDKKKKGIMKGNYVFKAQYRRGRARLSSGVKEIFTGGYRVSHNDRGGDWAVLVLKKRLGDTLGWFGISDYETDDLLKITDHYKLYMAGYANDYANSEVPIWQGNCSFHDRYFGTDVILTHDCSTTSGSSGSPMFIFVENEQGKKQAKIVAVHSGNQFGFNKNVAEKGEMVTFEKHTANLAVHASAFMATVRQLRARED